MISGKTGNNTVMVEIVIGIVLLLFGRPLFWAFVAFVGFLLGARLSEVLFVHQAPWVALLMALVFGIVGAVLAMFAERVAFALGGLVAGGYLGISMAQWLGFPGSPVLWLVIGGAVGALIAIWILDWAIIVMSCIVGAAAVVTNLEVGFNVAVAIYLVLFTVGALFQGSRLERVEPKPRA